MSDITNLLFKTKDENLYQSILDLLAYIELTYEDKYEAENFQPIKGSDFLYSPIHGKAVNIFSASKYLQRYLTEQYAKSNDPQDLLKAIHYLLIEYTRNKSQTNVCEVF